MARRRNPTHVPQYTESFYTVSVKGKNRRTGAMKRALTPLATEESFPVSYTEDANGKRRYTIETPSGDVSFNISAKRVASGDTQTAALFRSARTGRWRLERVTKSVGWGSAWVQVMLQDADLVYTAALNMEPSSIAQNPPPPPECEYTLIGADEESLDEWLETEDLYDVMNATEEIFIQSDIRPSSVEEPYEIAITQDERVIGGSTVSVQWDVAGTDDAKDEDWYFTEVTFSVAVDPYCRRMGVARALVKSIVGGDYDDGDGSPVKFHAWVVNPNMAKLLESMGFSTVGGGEWSEYDPHMEMWKP